MLAQQEYHSNMRRSFTRMFLAAAVLVSAAFAQGPPASVTSLGFGGNGNKGGGPPASVTSPGFGNTGQNRFFFNPQHQFHGNRNPKRTTISSRRIILAQCTQSQSHTTCH